MEYPAPDEIIDIILKRLEGKKLTPGMTGVKRGTNPSEIVFLTTEGDIQCQVTEDEDFIIFNLPLGKPLALPKRELA